MLRYSALALLAGLQKRKVVPQLEFKSTQLYFTHFCLAVNTMKNVEQLKLGLFGLRKAAQQGVLLTEERKKSSP